MRRRLIAMAIALVAGCSSSSDRPEAEQYCLDQGGMLVERVATWNTNAEPAAWL